MAIAQLRTRQFDVIIILCARQQQQFENITHLRALGLGTTTMLELVTKWERFHVGRFCVLQHCWHLPKALCQHAVLLHWASLAARGPRTLVHSGWQPVNWIQLISSKLLICLTVAAVIGIFAAPSVVYRQQDIDINGAFRRGFQESLSWSQPPARRRDNCNRLNWKDLPFHEYWVGCLCLLTLVSFVPYHVTSLPSTRPVSY